MRTSHVMVVALVVGMGAAGCDGDSEPTTFPEGPRAARIEAATATDLTGMVGTELTPAPTVRAVDAQDKPVRGVAVSFELGSGGGTITNPSVETDAQGLATVGKWTLGPSAGTYELTASSAGLDQVVFTAKAELPRMEAATATDLTGTVGTELTPAPAVRVVDAQGGPVRGVAISFQMGTGGGTITNASAETDTDGLATVGKWTLGPTAGSYELTASSAGLVPVVFTARAKAGPLSQITRMSGDEQIAVVGDRLPKHLWVRVADSFGNPIAGAPVTFTVIAGNGSIENGWVVTGLGGSAGSGAWTLGPTAGVQQVKAESGSAQVVFSALAIPTTDLIAFTTFVNSSFTPMLFLMDATGRFSKSLNQEGHMPAWSPDGTKIAFVHPFGGAIHVMNRDGSGVTRLTDSVAAYQPAWSPDGMRIAFYTYTYAGGVIFDIYVINADGTGLTNLTKTLLAQETDPAWSPDGTTIAFARELAGDREIYIMNADGSGLTQLTHDPAHDFGPAWSPDGTKIAFVSDRTAAFDIYVMNADGSRVTRLTNGSVRGEAPTWSPDGTRIAFAGGEGEDWGEIVNQIYVMNADGSAIRLLSPCAPSGWCFAKNWPAWHP